MRHSGVKERVYPQSVVEAFDRGEQLRRITYHGVPCTIDIKDTGSHWQIRVTRVSDGNQTTDLIDK
jgi:hypothetical protein